MSPAGRKNRFGEPSRSITTRLPVSVFNELGEDPSTAIGDIVVEHFKRKRAKQNRMKEKE